MRPRHSKRGLGFKTNMSASTTDTGFVNEAHFLFLWHLNFVNDNSGNSPLNDSKHCIN